MPTDQSITVFPLTPDRIADFETLFGAQGACYGCWCTYFLLPSKQRGATPAAVKKDLMLDEIRNGPPPGLLAYRDAVPIGWMRIGPRASVPEWNNPGRATTPLADAPAQDTAVWAISCFYFKAGERGKGLSHRMLAEGIEFARQNGARLLEASPMDRAKQSKSIGLYVGSTGAFAKAGFHEMARQKPGRPLMRLDLQ